MQRNLKKKNFLSVLFLPRWYPYKEDPMFGLFVERHARSLVAEVSVKVLFVHPIEGLPAGLRFDHHWKNGIETLCVHYNNKPTSYRPLNLLLSLVSYYKATLQGYRLLYPETPPDLCHVHVLTRPAILAFMLFLLKGTPYIITEHWSRYHSNLKRYNGFFRKRITSLIASRAKAITAVSNHLREAMMECKINNQRFLILPNIVDTKLFHPDNTIPRSTIIKTILHISTFEDNSKNLSGIVRTIKKLSEIRCDFRLRLVGYGPDWEKIKEMSDEMGLTDRIIEFPGIALEAEVTRQLNHSAFLLLFSNYENQPVVILESFACGKPVVATRVGGVGEIVNTERGILVEPGNETGLLNALNCMLSNFTEYDSKNIRRFAIENFSQEVVSEKMISLYKSSINYRS